MLGSVVRAVVYFLESPNLTITDAFLNQCFGLTTTGATTLVGWTHYRTPFSLSVRCRNGLGIIVLAVAILPILGVGDAALSGRNAGAAEKITKCARVRAETAKCRGLIHVLLTVACALALWFAGCPRSGRYLSPASPLSLSAAFNA
ncbi:hypothetical protein KCP71_05545 [Salmonella enterica subsp. enterica]|nr:hypothetical protein KCP71_05545 [Salmonella enterica subsp. enterica]